MLSLQLTLALSAFLAATLVPLSSEVALGAVIAAGADPWLTLLVASSANTAGSVVNWLLGRGIVHFQQRAWFPVNPQQLAVAQQRFTRYGQWSLLLAWVPLIGDPLTVVAGVLRVNFLIFVLLVAIGKTARYALVLFIIT
jgi:membrane protein YqaA with SNARE-associated domain